MAKFINELTNYQPIPRALIFDSTISDRARFVYCFMASKPDDWDFLLEPMAKEIGYGIDTLRKYLNELVVGGWLEKGEQDRNSGMFGAVQYTLKATKNTDTGFFRHGEIPTQHNIDIIQKRDYNIKEERDKTLSKKDEKDELFEQCWKDYRRKGAKAKAKKIWDKLTQKDKDKIQPHIKAYVSSRDLQYQKDFERYLKDKVFDTLVIANNKVVYDPTLTTSDEYRPTLSSLLLYHNELNCYLYIGYFSGFIGDGYEDDNRPDGATVMLNNGRGNITWNKANKQWILTK